MSPKRFGKYEVLARLATGGAASIFLARQPGAAGFHKLVCLKTLLPERASDADFVAMFLDEARLAARLNHPNCVQIFDLGRVRGSYYISMEYLFGETLWNLLATVTKLRTPLPPSHVASIISSVCDGLHHAHELKDSNGRPFNLVHRDVSPQNVMVTFEGQTKVVDFGIAKAETGRAPTVAGIVKGKFSYMSPEQITGGTIDRRSDVYSLGIVLFECLASRRLYRGDSPEEIARLILEHRAPRLRDVVPDIPAGLDVICAAALARHPSKRFQTAHAMGEALRDHLDSVRYTHSAAAIARLLEDRFRGQIAERRKVFESALSGTCDEAHLLKVLDARAVRDVDLFPEGVSDDADSESYVEGGAIIDSESLIFFGRPSGAGAATLSNETIDGEEGTGEVTHGPTTTAPGSGAPAPGSVTGASARALLGPLEEAVPSSVLEAADESPSDDGDRTCIDDRAIEPFVDPGTGGAGADSDSTSIDLEAASAAIGAAAAHSDTAPPAGSGSGRSPVTEPARSTGSSAAASPQTGRDSQRIASLGSSGVTGAATEAADDRGRASKSTRDSNPPPLVGGPPAVPPRRATQAPSSTRPAFGVSVEAAVSRQGPVVVRSRSVVSQDGSRADVRRSSLVPAAASGGAPFPDAGDARTSGAASERLDGGGPLPQISFADAPRVAALETGAADGDLEKLRTTEPEGLHKLSDAVLSSLPREGVRRPWSGSSAAVPDLSSLRVASLPLAAEQRTVVPVPVTKATAVFVTRFGSAALLAALGFGIAIGIIIGVLLARVLYSPFLEPGPLMTAEPAIVDPLLPVTGPALAPAERDPRPEPSAVRRGR